MHRGLVSFISPLIERYQTNSYLGCRGKFQGIIGVVVAFGYAVGPILGGALAQKVNWRVCTRSVAAVGDTNTEVSYFPPMLNRTSGAFGSSPRSLWLRQLS